MESQTRLGASRKKIASDASRQPSDAQRLYYERLEEIRNRLTKEGVDVEVSLLWKMERLTWAMGVSLIAPSEVRNESEAASLARLARRLILGETTLDVEFPEYRYNRADWLREI
jgi:hypothetical protein